MHGGGGGVLTTSPCLLDTKRHAEVGRTLQPGHGRAPGHQLVRALVMQASRDQSPGLPVCGGAVWRKRARRTPEEVFAYTRVFFLILIV